MDPSEHRRIYRDPDLDLEAYRLQGVVQTFPNHFHDYYVAGFLEGGRRRLWCRGRAYDLAPGDLVLFHPGDNHFCTPVDGEGLDYRAVHLPVPLMARAAAALTGQDRPPRFLQNVAPRSDLCLPLGDLYTAMVQKAPRRAREEALHLFLEQLLRDHAAPPGAEEDPAPDERVAALCAHMEAHCAENLSLDDLVALTDCGKSYLLRSFTRQLGVSPYRYLQNIRLGRAKALLEQGLPPAEAALAAGFSDQSHFTRCFKDFIGLTPGQYQRMFQKREEPLHV